jgi:hypothetical protein
VLSSAMLAPPQFTIEPALTPVTILASPKSRFLGRGQEPSLLKCAWVGVAISSIRATRMANKDLLDWEEFSSTFGGLL